MPGDRTIGFGIPDVLTFSPYIPPFFSIQRKFVPGVHPSSPSLSTRKCQWVIEHTLQAYDPNSWAYS
eukprot:11848920-Prorocentrum_lima.AAC.1